MLRICDVYKIQAEYKGGSCTLNPSVVIITSNDPWSLWDKWKGFNKDAFDRRVTDWVELKWMYDRATGNRDCEAHIIRGKFEDSFVDPPEIDEDRITDEQVEMLLAQRPNSRWLPKRLKPNYEVLQVPTPHQIVPDSPLRLSQL